MPLVEIEIIEGELSKGETKKLIEGVINVLASLLGKNMRNHIWVIVQEIKGECFGAGGQVCELEDIRAIQAGTTENAEE